MAMDEPDFIDTMKDILERRRPRRMLERHSHYREAAVLIPIYEKGGDYRILFTKRAPQVKYHRGHISFPGGVRDKEDRSPMETALRESYEEIGIHEKDVEILGPIDDAITFVPPFIVHPYVGRIPYPYHFSINTEEVEKIIAVPMDFFLPDNTGEDGDSFTDGGDLYYPEYHFRGELIWGTTASIVANLISILRKRFVLP